MIIKILGTGCTKCTTLERKVRDLVQLHNFDATVEKVNQIQDIMKYGIMSTPGLVVNEKLVSYGVIPKDEQILQWINEG